MMIPESTFQERMELKRIMRALKPGKSVVILSEEEYRKINQIFQDRPSLP